MNDSVGSATAETMREHLVGRKIVGADLKAQELTLDDGTTLTVVDCTDCCSWFEVARMELFDFENNAITNVTQNKSGLSGDGYTLTILSRDKKVAELEIDGSEGSGYYYLAAKLVVESP